MADQLLYKEVVVHGAAVRSITDIFREGSVHPPVENCAFFERKGNTATFTFLGPRCSHLCNGYELLRVHAFPTKGQFGGKGRTSVKLRALKDERLHGAIISQESLTTLDRALDWVSAALREQDP